MQRKGFKIFQVISILILCTGMSSCTWLLNKMLFPNVAHYISIDRQADISTMFPHTCIKQALLTLDDVTKIDFNQSQYVTKTAQIIIHHNYAYHTKSDKAKKRISITQRDGVIVDVKHTISLTDNNKIEAKNERQMMYRVEEAIEKICGLPPASFYDFRHCKKAHRPDSASYDMGGTYSLPCPKQK